MRKLDFLLLICIVVSAILLASCECSDDDQDESVNTDVIIPLAVGNEWTYLYTSSTYTDTLRIGITGSMTLDTGDRESRIAYLWSWFDFETGQYSDFSWLRYNTEEGFHSAGGISPSDTLLLDYLQLKYPVSKGESWIYPDLEYDYIEDEWIVNDTLEAFCTAVDTLVSTPAGDFSCVEVTLCYLGTTPGEYYVQRFYYAPKIGYIGFRLFAGGEVTASRLLMDYNLR